MGVHWKIQFLGGVHKKPINQYIGGNYLKRGGRGGLGQFADLREGRGVDTLMHTMWNSGFCQKNVLYESQQRCIQNPIKHLRWNFLRT